MIHPRPTSAVLAAAVAAALTTATAAPAYAADDEAQLRQLIELQAQQIRQQQTQIDALNQRLSALEKPAVVTASTAAPAATTAATAAAASPAELDALQARVAELEARKSGGNIAWGSGGPVISSDDGQNSFRIRGRVLLDLTGTEGSSYDARNVNGTNLNSGRLGVEGTFDKVGYKIEADFANNAVSMKDVYLLWNTKVGGVPAEVYVGSKFKDSSLEGGTSGLYTPFMTRDAVASVGGMQSGSYGLGGTLKLFGNNWHTSLSVTGDDVGNSGNASDTIAYLLRGHWNPVKREDGFMHVGGWYWYEDLGKNITSISKSVPVALSWNSEVQVVAEPVLDVDKDHAWGAELGGVWHSGWVYAETTARTIDSYTQSSSEQKAHSVSAGWLLTGEKPGFSARTGLWGATKVLNPATRGGTGAVELLARYDKYDFTDAALGGEGDVWTLGVNWYLNDYIRLMANAAHWTTDNKTGAYLGKDSGNSIGVRAQVSF